MKQIGDKSEREFEWELNDWSLGVGQADPEQRYNLWIEHHPLAGAILHLSNTYDLHESIEISSREILDELIARLIRARDESFLPLISD